MADKTGREVKSCQNVTQRVQDYHKQSKFQPAIFSKQFVEIITLFPKYLILMSSQTTPIPAVPRSACFMTLQILTVQSWFTLIDLIFSSC